MISNEIRESLHIICSALNDQGVEYMLIGGIAVGFYGYQRPSGVAKYGIQETKPDLDFWYNPRLKNYYKLLAALKELGKDTSRLENEVFDPHKTYLRIQYPTFKTEFLPQMKGLELFEKCFSRVKHVDFDGYRLSIIGFSDLMKNKEAVGREIDRSDTIELKKIRKGKDPL